MRNFWSIHTMKRLGLSVGLLAAACNNAEYGIVPTHLATPELSGNACTLEPGGDPLGKVDLDLGLVLGSAFPQQNSLSLGVVVSNILANEEVVLSQQAPMDRFITNNRVTPLRFDYRWECESQGFTVGLSPIEVPVFGVGKPFCLDDRAESKDFQGTDIIAATGPTVLPGELGVWLIRPVTTQLATGFRDVFQLAELAEQCCDEVNGCDNLQNANLQTGACATLQATFDSVAGPNVLSAQDQGDVEKWRGFVAYTPSNGLLTTPSYNMRIRGFFEGVTPSGSLVTSSLFSTEIGICASGPNQLSCSTEVVRACLQ